MNETAILKAYRLFNLSPETSTPDMVKAAFVRLIKKHHPDLLENQQRWEEANAFSRRLIEAYDTLKANGFPRLAVEVKTSSMHSAFERAANSWRQQPDTERPWFNDFYWGIRGTGEHPVLVSANAGTKLLYWCFWGVFVFGAGIAAAPTAFSGAQIDWRGLTIGVLLWLCFVYACGYHIVGNYIALATYWRQRRARTIMSDESINK